MLACLASAPFPRSWGLLCSYQVSLATPTSHFASHTSPWATVGIRDRTPLALWWQGWDANLVFVFGLPAAPVLYCSKTIMGQ